MEENDLKTQWSDQLFGVRRSVRYHIHRRKFFDTLSVWSDFLIIISGGTVVGFASSGEAGHHTGTIVFGSLIAIIGAFDLVVGFSNRGRDHHDLARQFSELEREMTAVGDSKTKENLIVFTNKRLAIEENEPPVLQVLNAYCHNELVKAEGTDKKYRAKISLLQSALKQWLDIFPDSVEIPDWPKNICT